MNELPVSIVLSWFEQKRLPFYSGYLVLEFKIFASPKAPEFISPGVLDVLQETFGLKLITNAKRRHGYDVIVTEKMFSLNCGFINHLYVCE